MNELAPIRNFLDADVLHIVYASYSYNIIKNERRRALHATAQITNVGLAHLSQALTDVYDVPTLDHIE